MKICSKCNQGKDIELFKKDKRRIDGCSNICKECNNINSLNYYNRTKESRKDTINQNRRNSYINNKEKEKSASKKWKENNKEYIKEYNSKYNNENKSQNIIRRKKWRENNKEYIRYSSREYIRYRLLNDELFKLKYYTRNMIRKSFKNGEYSKKSNTQEILGCSFEEFKLYLESQFEEWMNWDNKGLYNGELNYGWDIDHKIPLSSATSEEDIIKLNHYTNLQPLCSYINRYIKKDLIYLEQCFF